MQAAFANADTVVRLLTYIAEDVSRQFDRWEDPYIRGPSLYFVLASGVRFDSFADPLGNNRWPIDDVRILTRDLTSAVQAAHDIAFECDGAVVLTADGTFQEQMVRIRTPNDPELTALEYPDWMSAKHLSALEVSGRQEILGVVTLSEEDGRVTTFRDGGFTDHQRDEIGGRWRTA
ncbi:MAG: hypothetical protein SVG88_01675 [Halobacteriales archaeon]|nr:hypothetical protein [Halobacteriales archaeon]